jgi:hypothetical protein
MTNGFRPAARYEVITLINSSGTELLIAADEKYKISGKEARPIIELTGGVLRSNGLDGDNNNVLVIYMNNSIIITIE